MDNDTNGICEAVEAGDLHGCLDCRAVSDCGYCPECDEGRCDICGALVKKGETFMRDPEFDGSMFCSDPKCSDIAAQPTVADLAARLGNGGAS